MPSRQLLVDCAAGLVREYDEGGINCQTTTIGLRDTVDARICATCGMPFGIRDTNGVYRVGESVQQTVMWSNATKDAANSTTTYHGRVDGASLEIAFTFAADGTPMQQAILQDGWQRLLVNFSNFSADDFDDVSPRPPSAHRTPPAAAPPPLSCALPA